MPQDTLFECGDPSFSTAADSAAALPLCIIAFSPTAAFAWDCCQVRPMTASAQTATRCTDDLCMIAKAPADSSCTPCALSPAAAAALAGGLLGFLVSESRDGRCLSEDLPAGGHQLLLSPVCQCPQMLCPTAIYPVYHLLCIRSLPGSLRSQSWHALIMWNGYRYVTSAYTPFYSGHCHQQACQAAIVVNRAT